MIYYNLISNNTQEVTFENHQRKSLFKELYIKPIGAYPYNIAEINELEFLKIDNKHYGEG